MSSLSNIISAHTGGHPAKQVRSLCNADLKMYCSSTCFSPALDTVFIAILGFVWYSDIYDTVSEF